MENLNIVIAGVAIVGSICTLSADDMSSKMGNIPIGNVAGSTGNVFSEGKSRFVIKNVSVSKDTAYDGDDEVSDSANRKMTVNMTNILYRYGLSNGFDVRVMTHYVQKDQEMTKMGRDLKLSNSGLGDSAIVFRYQLLNQQKGAPLFLAIGGGVKLPTGSASKSFTTAVGVMSPSKTQTMQLGSGSYDYIAEIGTTRFLPNSRIDAHMMYTLTTEGSNDYEFGNTLQWNLGYSYAINQYFDLQLELDGMHKEKNKYQGIDVDTTGGNFVYITPGIHILLSKKYDISLGYSHMIYRDNNYDASKNMGGLSEDYKLVLRVGYNF